MVLLFYLYSSMQMHFDTSFSASVCVIVVYKCKSCELQTLAYSILAFGIKMTSQNGGHSLSSGGASSGCRCRLKIVVIIISTDWTVLLLS